MRGEKIMPSTQNAVNNHEYRSVPITALAESATNPRKRFDPKSLEELAASFKTQGILALHLVRELEVSPGLPVSASDRSMGAFLERACSVRGLEHSAAAHRHSSEIPRLSKSIYVGAKSSGAD